MSRQSNDPDNDIKLSDEEIRARVQSLRSQSTSRRTEGGVTGRVTDTVGDVSRNAVMVILGLLRIPLAIIGVLLGYAFFNGQEWTNFIGAVALALVTGFVVFFIVSRVLAFIEYQGFKNQVRRG